MAPGNAELMMPEIDFGTDPVPDLPERLSKLQQDGHQLVRVRYFGGTAWLVLGYENVSKVFSDDAHLPAATQWNREFDTAGKTLLHMQGDEHRKYKAAFSPPFSFTAVRELIGKVLVPAADEIIDGFSTSREVELNGEYCRRYSFNVISRMLGISVKPDEEAELRERVDNLFQQKEFNLPADFRRARALAAVEKINAFLKPVIEAHRAEPRDDLMSYLLAVKIDGVPIDDEEIYRWVRFFYLGGADTTGLMLGNVLLTILSQAGLKEDLLAHPEKRAAAIDESVRLFGLTGLHPRYTAGPVTILGVEIPANSYVLLGVPGANRAERQFPEPHKFSMDRKRNPSLTFGAGPHFCLGTVLAREEMRVSVNQLLDRLPGLRLAGEPDPIQNCHLRFASQLRVQFDAVVASKAT